jgi:SAM-dependent methyltransferase
MAKAMEKEYASKIGEAGRLHILAKPFSDSYCGLNLAAIGTIIDLLPPRPARVLDMGCGGGWTSSFMARSGYEVIGQDISPDMVELAREYQAINSPDSALSFRCGDFEFAEEEGAFDAVVFFDSLHHADDEQAAIETAYRALKPGGVLITHEPGEGHATATHSLEAIALYGVTEKDMPPHLIIRHGKQAGFSHSRVYPMQQDLIETFYRQPIPNLLSKTGFLRLRRIFRAAFRPSHRASAIVVLTK